MKAILLAAGRGARLRPWTDTVPKPLLPVGGRPLIEWHLLALARAGVRDIVVNTAWLGEQFPLALGDGARWGVRLRYSMEGRDHGQALETAGGIAKALPLLVDAPEEPFWAIAADICAPAFDHAASSAAAAGAFDAGRWAHLWMVPNLPDHPRGDFTLAAGGRLQPRHGTAPGTDDRTVTGTGDAADCGTCTYAGIGLYRAAAFEGLAAGSVAALGPLLQAAVANGRVDGALYRGPWANVGTPEQLARVDGPDWRAVLRRAAGADRPGSRAVDDRPR